MLGLAGALVLGRFAASLLHGVTAGTDSRTPLMIGLYIGSAVVVAGLMGLRMTHAEAQMDRASDPTRNRSGDGQDRTALPSLNP